MKIERITVRQVSKPLSQTLVNSLYTIERIEHVLVEIDAEGLTGIGFCFSFQQTQSAALKRLIEGYAEGLIGKEVEQIRGHWNDMQTLANGIGQTGLMIVAWAAIDIALWDLLGKEAGLPLYKLLGAWRDEVPVYASGGWLVPVGQLVEEAAMYKEQGYKQYKMKFGSADWREDIRRVEAIRKEVGDDLEIFVDVNQGWSVKKTLLAAAELRNLGVTYLEEPLHARDFCGQAEVRKNVDINVVAGESLFTVTDHFELMRQGCVDMINPDLQRCGGITEYMQVCALAGAYRIPVTSHVFTEASVHLMAAAPTATVAEYVPDWWRGIFAEEITVREGRCQLTDRPGLGLAFNSDTIQKYGLK